MRRCWKAVLLLTVGSIFWAFSVPAQEVQVPKMVVKELVYDFKEVMEGSVIQHTFQVFNEGDQTLEIKNVRPG